jgi:hypothetical protein
VAFEASSGSTNLALPAKMKTNMSANVNKDSTEEAV